VVVDPAVYAALPVPGAPGIRLDGALADGDAVSLQGAAVPRGRGELELRYHGISLTAPEDVRYRYRLEGLDSEWREAGPETKARYTSLPPGKYSFRVQASRGGAWSTEAVTGDIQLLPHFTETYPFKGLMVAALGALAWAIHWARTRALLARAAVLAERNRLAREIHDGLTQSLTGILIQLEAALRRWGGAAEGSKEHVERARDWARLSLSETRSAVAALRQSIGSTEALAAALQRAGEALTSGTAVRFDVTSAGNEALPAELGEALLRIGQEALTNALRHGKPGSVEIRVEAKDSRVRLLVRDDGKGFDPEAVGPWGTGLRGMRERAGAAGASIDVRSRPGGPTEVEATAPLSGKEAVVRRSPVGPAGAR
jgi:signal transduction histidine kinase